MLAVAFVDGLSPKGSQIATKGFEEILSANAMYAMFLFVCLAIKLFIR
jgi:hypothetical protein